MIIENGQLIMMTPFRKSSFSLSIVNYPLSISLTIGLLLAILLPAAGAWAEGFALRSIKHGDKLPMIEGNEISTKKPFSYRPGAGRPAVIVFFSIDPLIKEKRSLDLISQASAVVNGSFRDRVDLILVYSDEGDLATLGRYIQDGVVPSPVVHDPAHAIYNRFGVFMMPLAILATTDGRLHEVIPATYNAGELLAQHLKLLLGEWGEEDLRNAQKPKYTSTLTQDEKEYIRRVNYGRLMLARKMYPPAARELSTAAKIRPQAPEAWIGLGNVHLASEKWDEAIGAFGKALEANRESDEALAGIGIALYRQGRVDRALPVLENALIAADPKIEVILALAEIYEERGDMVKATRLNKLAVSKLRERFR